MGVDVDWNAIAISQFEAHERFRAWLFFGSLVGGIFLVMFGREVGLMLTILVIGFAETSR